jgi:hypothetical protein
MALLEEIGGRLTVAGLCSSSGMNGYTLIKSWLPDSSAIPDRVVALIETGGFAPMLPVEIDQPTFQVKVRGNVAAATSAGYSGARAEAESIKNELHGLGAILLPTSSAAGARYYVQIAAQQEPALLHYDQQQRPVIVCNFRAMRSRT